MLVVLVSVGMAAVWLWHTIAAVLGMPKVPDISGPEWVTSALEDERLPRVSIIVPARNEEAMIGDAVRSLLAIDYPNFEVLAIDDRSEDRTGAILDGLEVEFAGRLRVLHVNDLPARWLGKTHAMWAAAKIASGEWLLFTDADVLHAFDSLKRTVRYAERERADHVVLLPTLIMKSWGERMMISFFQALFIFAHRPWKVADPKAKDHMGVGAFNLVRRSAYDAIGGYERLRMAIVDDMRLGEVLKREGFAQRCVSGANLVRVRWANGALGVVRNLTKNFFAELKYNTAVALGASAAVLGIQLGPWLGVAFAPGWSRLGFAVALACVVVIYRVMSRWSSVPTAYVVTHPLATILLVYTMLRSTALALWQGGVVWRGTKYSLKELREAERA